MPIPEDSKFYVEGGGIPSGAEVVIRPGTSNQMLETNAVVHGKSVSGLLGSLKGGSSVQNQLKSLLSNLKNISGAPVSSQVRDILSSLASSADDLETTLARNRGTISDAVSNIDAIAGNNRGDVSAAVTALKKDAEDLRTSLTQMDTTMNAARSAASREGTLVKDLNAWQGSAGMLLTNTDLYNELTDTLNSIMRWSGTYGKTPESTSSFASSDHKRRQCR